MKKLALMCIVASMALGLQVGTAFAGTPGDSEIDQYTESLPNGGGNQPTNSPGGTNSDPSSSSTDPSGTTDAGSTDAGSTDTGSADTGGTNSNGSSSGSGGGSGSGGDDAEKLGNFVQSSSPGSSGGSNAPLINASGAGDDSDSLLDTLTGSGGAGPILPIILIVAILGGSAYLVRMRRNA